MKTQSNTNRKLEQRLDEALEATFPCSDPVSINQLGAYPNDATPAKKTSADTDVRSEEGGRRRK
jgi:hypothetical protein